MVIRKTVILDCPKDGKVSCNIVASDEPYVSWNPKNEQLCHIFRGEEPYIEVECKCNRQFRKNLSALDQ